VILSRKLRSAASLLFEPKPIQGLSARVAQNLRGAYLRWHGDSPFRFRFGRLFDYVVVPSIRETVELYLLRQNYESSESTIIHKWLSPGDLVVDCGANVGLITALMAHAVGSEGKVLAVEAAPSTLAKLTTVITCLGLSQVLVCEKAISDSNGWVSFSDDAFRSDANFVVQSDRSTENTCHVETITIDQLLADELKAPAAIKLDIEGDEPIAFRGWESLHKTPDPPLIVFEVYPRGLERQGSNPAEIFDSIPVQRYKFWHLNSSWPNERPEYPNGVVFRLLDPYSHRWPMHSNVIGVPLEGEFACRVTRLNGLLRGL
jgi:FkbM family methyltransferase